MPLGQRYDATIRTLGTILVMLLLFVLSVECAFITGIVP